MALCILTVETFVEKIVSTTEAMARLASKSNYQNILDGDHTYVFFYFIFLFVSVENYHDD
jgi:hypothetical protein